MKSVEFEIAQKEHDCRGREHGQRDANQAWHDGSVAGWAGAKEFQLMVEILIAGFFAYLILQGMNGAGGLDGLNGAALSAYEVILMSPWDEKGEISCSFMQPKSTDDALICKPLKESEDGGLVALIRKLWRLRQLIQGHGAIVLQQSSDELLESFGAAHAKSAAALNRHCKLIIHCWSDFIHNGWVGKWNSCDSGRSLNRSDKANDLSDCFKGV